MRSTVLVVVVLALTARTAADTVYVNGCAGGIGDGSSGNPYPTVTQAVTAGSTGSTIVISSTKYPETLLIDKALTLQAVGGPVLIGTEDHVVSTMDVCVPLQAMQGGCCFGAPPECDPGSPAGTCGLVNELPAVNARVYYPSRENGRVDCGGPFPVVVYAHGHRTPTEVLCSWSDPGPVHQDYLQAEEILTRLATSGMIVISPDVSCGEFNIGRASVVLNALAYLRDEHGSSGSALEGGVDMRRVGLAGHSRGGGGAVFAANMSQDSFFSVLGLGDLRVQALGLISPGLPNPNGPIESVPGDPPVLVIHGTNDTLQVADGPTTIYADAEGTKHFVVVEGANHFGYTDQICLDPTDGWDNASTVGGLSDEAAQALQRRTATRYLHAFFSHYLIGSPNAIDVLVQMPPQECKNPGDPPLCGQPFEYFGDLQGANVGVSVCSCGP